MKKVLALIFVFIMIFCFTACGGREKEKAIIEVLISDVWINTADETETIVFYEESNKKGYGAYDVYWDGVDVGGYYWKVTEDGYIKTYVQGFSSDFCGYETLEYVDGVPIYYNGYDGYFVRECDYNKIK